MLNMHQIQNFLGLRPTPHWGSLQRSPRPPCWVEGGRFAAGEGRGGEALAVEPSHFSTGSDATEPNKNNQETEHTNNIKIHNLKKSP